MNHLDLIPLASGDPSFVQTWIDICREGHRKEQAWLEELRRLGIKAAHPDDGWVDRRKNSVFFCYPYFNLHPEVGDRIALGNYKKWRIVQVTKICELRSYRGNFDYYFTEKLRS